MKKTFSRFPGVLLSAIFAAILIIIQIERGTDVEGRLVGSVLLGIPLFLMLTFFRESKNLTSRKDMAIELAGGTLLLALHLFLTEDEPQQTYVLHYIQLSLALHLSVSFIAFLNDRDDQAFWQLNKTIFLRILYSALYAAVFFGGIAIAIVTVQELFNVKVHEKLYADLWVLSALILQTWHFLAGLPKLGDLRKDLEFPRGLRIFVQYLLIPLVSLYMVILYCYMAKILIFQDWSRVYVGWLVSVMSVLGIFNLLLVDPEKYKPETRWIAGYAKAFYILVLPLLGMLFLAVGKRVSVYGITEQRYFLILLGLLLGGLAIYFIFSRAKSIRAVPIALCAIAVLSYAGPWSAYSVSRQSQLRLARKILAQKPITADAQKQLSSIIEYLYRYHDPSYALSLLPPEKRGQMDKIRDANGYGSARATETMHLLGLEKVDKYNQPEGRYISFGIDPDAYQFDIQGYETLVNFSTARMSQKVLVAGRVFDMRVDQGEAKLEFDEQGKGKFQVDFAPKITKLIADNGLSGSRMQPKELVFEQKIKGLTVHVQLQSITGKMKEAEVDLNHLSGFVLLK